MKRKTKPKLYLVTTSEVDYDEYDAFVLVAIDAIDAFSRVSHLPNFRSDTTTVKFVGYLEDESLLNRTGCRLPKQVLLDSYNAG